MDLIDKEDDRAGALFDLAQHRLEPLFELPAELAAGDQGSHVQRDHASLLEPFRHVAVHDPLRQPLRDRRLAHARLTDQARIVLGASGEDLDHAADFFVPADDGVQLALAGQVSEDRKSTRLNSSHGYISYAVFCLKKKNTKLGRHAS